MSYCVVPQALADELYVEVIIDRRARGGSPGDHDAHADRRRQRPKGSFPPIDPPAGAATS